MDRTRMEFFIIDADFLPNTTEPGPTAPAVGTGESREDYQGLSQKGPGINQKTERHEALTAPPRKIAALVSSARRSRCARRNTASHNFENCAPPLAPTEPGHILPGAFQSKCLTRNTTPKTAREEPLKPRHKRWSHRFFLESPAHKLPTMNDQVRAREPPPTTPKSREKGPAQHGTTEFHRSLSSTRFAHSSSQSGGEGQNRRSRGHAR